MRGRRSRRRTYHPGRLRGGRPEQRGHRHLSAVKSSLTQMTTGAAAVKQVLMISNQFFVSPHAHDPHAPPHACTSPCPPTCSSAARLPSLPHARMHARIHPHPLAHLPHVFPHACPCTAARPPTRTSSLLHACSHSCPPARPPAEHPPSRPLIHGCMSFVKQAHMHTQTIRF